MSLEDKDLSFIKNLSIRKIFYLTHGLKIQNLRQLLFQLTKMKKQTFQRYMEKKRSIFLLWIAKVFRDEPLYHNLKQVRTKKDVTTQILQRIQTLEKKRLEQFNLSNAAQTINQIETVINDLIQAGYQPDLIRQKLKQKDIKGGLIELTIANTDFESESLADINNLEKALLQYKKVKEFHRYLLTKAADGVSPSELESFLRKNGFSQKKTTYIVRRSHEPDRNAKKLIMYLRKELFQGDKNLTEVKQKLKDSKWHDVAIEHLVHGINPPEKSVFQIINRLTQWNPETKRNIRKYLKLLGWDPEQIQEGMNRFDIFLNIKQIKAILNTANITFDKNNFHNHFYATQINSHSQIAKALSNNYTVLYDKDLDIKSKKINVERVQNKYYDYNKTPLTQQGLTTTGQLFYVPSGDHLIYLTENSLYIFSPKMQEKKCSVCGKSFKPANLEKFEFWNEDKTTKITKYACLKHKDVLKSQKIDQKIVQS